MTILDDGYVPGSKVSEMEELPPAFWHTFLGAKRFFCDVCFAFDIDEENYDRHRLNCFTGTVDNRKRERTRRSRNGIAQCPYNYVDATRKMCNIFYQTPYLGPQNATKVIFTSHFANVVTKGHQGCVESLRKMFQWSRLPSI